MDYCRQAPPAPAPSAPALPVPAPHQRTWTEDYAAAHHASQLHASGLPSMNNIPVPDLPSPAPREHLAATLGLNTGDHNEATPPAPLRASPAPVETSDMDIPPGTLPAQAPPRSSGPRELPSTTRRSLCDQLTAR
jgi:hypothetical protein